jgi:hypothetical protein
MWRPLWVVQYLSVGITTFTTALDNICDKAATHQDNAVTSTQKQDIALCVWQADRSTLKGTGKELVWKLGWRVSHQQLIVREAATTVPYQTLPCLRPLALGRVFQLEESEKQVTAWGNWMSLRLVLIFTLSRSRLSGWALNGNPDGGGGMVSSIIDGGM